MPPTYLRTRPVIMVALDRRSRQRDIETPLLEILALHSRHLSTACGIGKHERRRWRREERRRIEEPVETGALGLPVAVAVVSTRGHACQGSTLKWESDDG